MSGDLQNELPVPPFVEQATRCRSLDGQAAKNEGLGREFKVLRLSFALFPNRADGSGLTQFPL
jgi:hypothetical protein